MLDTAGLDARFAANPVKVREHMADTDGEDDGCHGRSSHRLWVVCVPRRRTGDHISRISSPDALRDFLEIKDPRIRAW